MGVWRITPVPYTSSQLSAPTLSCAVISSTQINVTVGSVSNAIAYSLERSTDLNNWTVISNTSGTFNDTGRTGVTTYYYRVKAIGNGTTYTDSNYRYTTATTLKPQLATPVVVCSNPTSDGFDITWSEDAHADGSVLERSLFSDFSVIQDSLQLSGTGSGAWAYTGLASGTTYYVRVKVTDSTNTYSDSNYGIAGSITTLQSKLNVPGSFAAGVQSGAFMPLTWTDTNSSPNESNIEIQVATDSGFTNIVSTLTPGADSTDTSFNSGGVTGTKYARIRAKGNGTTTTDSDWSTTISFVIT
jgi:hypothetical protein